MSNDTEDTQLWWEKRIAKEAAEKDAAAGRYDPPPTDPARTIYDEIYLKLQKHLVAENHIISHIEPNEFQKLRADFSAIRWYRQEDPGQLGYILELNFPADEALEPIIFITKCTSLGQNCISDIFINGNKVSDDDTIIIASISRIIITNYRKGLVIDVPFLDIEVIKTRINDEIYIVENSIQTKDKHIVISSQFTAQTIDKASIILGHFFDCARVTPSDFPLSSFGASLSIPDRRSILAQRQLQIEHQRQQGSNDFNVSGCIFSFVITLLIAISLGLVIPFVIFLLTGSLPLAIVLYITLFGGVWWAIYNTLSRDR